MTNTTLASPPPPPPPSRMYGFNIYKDGRFVREQLVPAGSAAIAEVKVPRFLKGGEYAWYAVPRLVDPNSEGERVETLVDSESPDVVDRDPEEEAA